MKSFLIPVDLRILRSHPTRVRGLKSVCPSTVTGPWSVAPHPGAWIEIDDTHWTVYLLDKSHPTRVRGLKSCCHPACISACWSHPTRVRGLKFACLWMSANPGLSHPTRVRGLKSYRIALITWTVRVAPHAGAWIEMNCVAGKCLTPACRTPCGCVD